MGDTATAPLVATTRRLDTDLDLLVVAGDDGVVFERERVGLAGRGRALTIDIPAGVGDPGALVAERLGAIGLDDAVGVPGCGPVAFGALPFDPAAPRRLLVPEIVIGRADDGTRWVTTIAPADAVPDHDVLVGSLGITADRPESEIDPGEIRLRSARPAADWCGALRQGRDRLDGSGLRKFVLARELVVDTERPLPSSALLARLRAAFPSCYLTAVPPMIGASPELLVSRFGDIVRSRPMAGTARRSSDPTVDARLAAALLASTKDREEHQITIDMVHDTLLPWCSYLDAEPEPSVMAVANVQHLATFLEGRLSAPPASVLDLVVALHPTPAVCGSPTDAALALIAELEGADRGAYAGPVGWVDHQGNGEWAVGIRSAEVDGTRVRLFAGVGVVADSDPETELAETRAKFQAMLSVLVRP